MAMKTRSRIICIAMSKPTKKVTEQDVQLWMGDSATYADYAEIIAWVANGEYPIKTLKSEIEALKDE